MRTRNRGSLTTPRRPPGLLASTTWLVATAAFTGAALPAAATPLASGSRVVQQDQQWAEQAPLHRARAYLAAATGSDGRIYAIGGAVRQHPVVRVEAFDPAVGTWSQAPSLPTPTSHLAAASGPDGNVYAIGGCSAGACPTDAVFAYTPGRNRWRRVASLPSPRMGLAAAVGSDGRIYAYGGLDATINATTEVDAYDTVSGTWTAVAPLRVPSAFLAGAADRAGTVYAIGGYDTHDGVRRLSTVEAYDPATGTWTKRASLPTHVYAAAAVTASTDGRIYLVGGGRPTYRPSRHVSIFDPASNSWSDGPELPVGRLALAAAAVPGELLAIGGGLDDATGFRPVAEVEALAG